MFFVYACLPVEKMYVNASVGCVYNQKNYTACEIMLYTKWKPCNGTDCQLGLQTRGIGICCPKDGNQTNEEIKDNCKMNCNLTDADLLETATYNPPLTTLTTKSSSDAYTFTTSSTETIKTTPKLRFLTTDIKGRSLRLITVLYREKETSEKVDVSYFVKENSNKIN